MMIQKWLCIRTLTLNFPWMLIGWIRLECDVDQGFGILTFCTICLRRLFSASGPSLDRTLFWLLGMMTNQHPRCQNQFGLALRADSYIHYPCMGYEENWSLLLWFCWNLDSAGGLNWFWLQSPWRCLENSSVHRNSSAQGPNTFWVYSRGSALGKTWN